MSALAGPATDAIIIGAGIAGASTAYFLSKYAKAVVLEREPQPGYHATGRSAALFSATYGSPQIRALTRASRPFLDNPPPGFTDHPILTPRGALIIGTSDQTANVHADYQANREHTDVRLLTTAEMLSLVPVLEPHAAAAGLLEIGAADIDVNAVHQGFIRGLKARGSQLISGATIQRIGYSQGEWTVELGPAEGYSASGVGRSAAADGTPEVAGTHGAAGASAQVGLASARSARVLRAPLLINAAGAWVDEVAALAGVAPLGVEPRRRSAFIFAPPPGIDTAQWPFVTNVSEEFYFKPDAGQLLGSPANADPVSPHDVQPEDLDIAMGIHRIEEATTMRIHRPTRVWAGLRTFVADGGMVGGFDPAARGFFWVAALGGYGIQTCAAVGEACAHLALGRELPTHLADAGITADLLAPRR